jgi:hypothetical protein
MLRPREIHPAFRETIRHEVALRVPRLPNPDAWEEWARRGWESALGDDS